MLCLQCFRATVDSKQYQFTILLVLIIFKFIWQHHVPENEIYMFSVSYSKIYSYGCTGIFADSYIVDDYN